MKNLLAEKKLTAGQILLAAWMVFSIVFVLFSLWRFGLAASYQLGQQDGVRGAVTQTIAQATQQCEPFTVFNEAGRVDLINVACLQQAEGAADAANAEAPAAQ